MGYPKFPDSTWKVDQKVGTNKDENINANN